MTVAVQQLVAETIKNYPTNRVLVAFSGGLDSSVLLHCLTQRTNLEINLLAIHVNHHLDSESDQWQRHCQQQASLLNCPFTAVSAVLPTDHKLSPEEVARIGRYRALKSCMQKNDLLLVAHHANDQAETVLLQLLRGSGAQGLAAMPVRKVFADGHLLRPLLETSLAQIQAYAKQHQLSWLDDPANHNLNFDRNYIRHKVSKVLASRWRHWDTAICRAANHQGSLLRIVRQVEQQLLERCQQRDGTLLLDQCFDLTGDEKKLLLRYWLRQKNIIVPNQKQTNHLIQSFFTDPSSAGGVVTWKNGEVRRYRGRLYAMLPLPALACELEKQWKSDTDITISEIGQVLTWEALLAQLPEGARESAITVRLRTGGEKYLTPNGRMHRSLKKIFQEQSIPPWMRGRIPLIYVNNELRLVWGVSFL